MIYTELTKKAMRISFEAHKNDMDKGNVPYVYHPFFLATKMKQEEEIIVALLHDVIEDHGDVYSFSMLEKEGFPSDVIDALRLMTHNKGIPYLDYVEKISHNPIARHVKLADLEHNMDHTRTGGVYPPKYETYKKAHEILEKAEKEDILHSLIYGAIIGDIFGSNYEFTNHVEDKPQNLKGFPLMNGEENYTDDTVMTIAVTKALSKKEDISKTMREIAKDYPCPKGGYGGRFQAWLEDPAMGPYRSFGNGAGMRVSPVAYFAKNPKECKALAIQVTENTHNHLEGLKAAKTIALMTYYALHGKPRHFLKEYAEDHYPGCSKLDLEELHQHYGMEETCQKSVPQALYCFLSSTSFEDCLRRVCYIGGDADTIGAMACAIASAYYKKIPETLLRRAKSLLPKDFIEVLEKVPVSLEE